MTAAQLLAALDPLTHAGRVRHMIAVGRVRPAAALAGLAAGGPYARRMALWGHAGGGDGPAVERAAADPARSVRRLALHLAPSHCDDAAVARLSATLDPRRQRRLLVRLAKLKRRPVIDAHVDAAAAAQSRGWTGLLPLATAAVVARHAERFAESAAGLDWARLGHRHPALAADLLRRRADAADGLDRRLQSHAAEALPAISVWDPDAALALARSLARTVPVASLPLTALARRRADAVAELLLSADAVDPRSVLPARRLSPAVLGRWLDRSPGHGLGSPASWVPRLPPDRRADAYRRGRLAWQDAEGVLPPAVVAALPAADRHAEARRHLALAALSARPPQRLSYAELLPWAEAKAAVAADLRDADADVRGRAVAALIGSARRDPDHTADAVAEVVARRFEQDPVRLQMVTALAALPPRRWTADHLPDLAIVVRHALDAADLSQATAAAVERLLVRLVPAHPDWACRQIADVAAKRGTLTCFMLEPLLTDAQVRQLAGPLSGVVRSWLTRENTAQVVQAGRLFGRRVEAFPAMADALEAVARSAANDWVSESALTLLATHARPRAARLIPELVAADPTWVTRSVVRNYLLRHRQDLIGPCLGRAAHKGRFGTGKTRYYLPESDGLWRLTPTQQAALAATLGEVAADPERSVPSLLGAIRQLVAMPDVPADLLVRLAGDDARPAVRDAALRALARLDDGGGVPTLVAALADRRARVAIYALRSAVLEMPPARGLALLRSAPLGKVTVAKEVVRLIGDLRTDEAFAVLVAIDAGPLHRDVRAAVVRAAWAFADRPAAWDLIDRAVASGDPNLADPAGRVPVDGLSADGRARLAGVLAALLRHADVRVRLRALARLRELPLDDPGRVLLDPLLAAATSAVADERRAAAAAVFATYAGRAADAVGRLTAAVVGDRRAVSDLVAALTSAVAWADAGLVPTARAVVAVVAGDPVLAALRVRLAGLALPAGEVVAVLSESPLHADAVAAACGAVSSPARGAAHAEAVEAGLASSGDEALRRVAVAALVAAAGVGGWTDERRGRLVVYRSDPSPLVAGAAQFTFPPDA